MQKRIPLAVILYNFRLIFSPVYISGLAICPNAEVAHLCRRRGDSSVYCDQQVRCSLGTLIHIVSAFVQPVTCGTLSDYSAAWHDCCCRHKNFGRRHSEYKGFMKITCDGKRQCPPYVPTYDERYSILFKCVAPTGTAPGTSVPLNVSTTDDAHAPPVDPESNGTIFIVAVVGGPVLGVVVIGIVIFVCVRRRSQSARIETSSETREQNGPIEGRPDQILPSSSLNTQVSSAASPSSDDYIQPISSGPCKIEIYSNVPEDAAEIYETII